MHKSVLQELCQRNVWKLPEYSNVRDGPDHDPYFSAVVVVNGVSFQSSNICRTAKSAQNNAAEVAFNYLSGSRSVSKESSAAPNHLSSVIPTSQNGLEATLTVQSHAANVIQPPLTPVGVKDNKNSGNVIQPPLTPVGVKDNKNSGNVIQPPPTPVGVKDNKNSDGQHWYKSRLQSYAQRRNLVCPVYSFERQGPQHLSQFKCKVTVGGQSYEDTNFFFTLKEAENSVAKLAFEQVSPNEDQEDKPAFYKIFLHELAKKRGFLLPSYETKGIGPPHIPVFVATVKVGDKVYQGLSAMTKKQAEMSAAKSAYDSFQDGTTSLHLNEQQQQNGCTKKNLQMGPLHLNEQHQQNGCTKENLHKGPLHLNEHHQQEVCTKEILQLGKLHLNEQHQQNGYAKENLQTGTLHLNEQHQQNGHAKENLQTGPLHLNVQHQQNGHAKENLQTGQLHLNEQHQQKVCITENLQMAMKCESQLENPCVSEVISYPTTKSTENGFKYPLPMYHQQTTVTDGNNIPPPVDYPMADNNRVYQKILVYPRSKVPSCLLENGTASVMPCSDDKWVALMMNTNL